MLQYRYASFVLFTVLLTIIFSTFLDYGITWDEPARKEYGYKVLLWYSSFFQNDAAIQNIITNTYGGFFEATAQLFSGIIVLFTGSYLYEARHLLNAIFGFIGIVFTYRLGKLIAGEKAGFLSAFILAITPRYYGHIFNNSKDIPFAVLFLISSYYIFCSYRHFPNIPKKLIIKLGISIGLTLSVRIGGLLLYGYFLLIFSAWLFNSLCINKEFTKPLKQHIRTISYFGISFLSVVIISWAIMLFWWPWAQMAPLENPFTALSKVSDFPWKGSILYKGGFIKATDVPWDYIPTWLSISLPEFYFLFILLGAISTWKYINNIYHKNTKPGRQCMEILMLIFSVVFPIIYIIYKQSVLYDGIRHLLFIIPFLAIICGISFTSIFRHINSLIVRYTIIGISIFLAGITIYDMGSLHPYQTVYFNRLFGGGLSVAAQEYETDYWGNTYKEAAEWAVKHYSDTSSKTYTVAVCLFPQEILSYYLNSALYIQQEIPKLEYIFHIDHSKESTSTGASTGTQFIADEMENSDIIIAYRRLNCHRMITGFLQHTIVRKGTPLAFIVGPNR
jgi:hypothetical protein